MRSHRYQVSLIVVAATGDQVTSTIHDTNAADRHRGVSSMRSNNTLPEFLRRRDEFAIPAGIPVVRFDTTDVAVTFAFRTRGPSHLEYLPAGAMQGPTAPKRPTTAGRGTSWPASTSVTTSTPRSPNRPVCASSASTGTTEPPTRIRRRRVPLTATRSPTSRNV